MFRTSNIILFLVLGWFSQGMSAENFYACYTNIPDSYPALLQYQDSLFGRYADVIVHARQGQLIFSRETSYLPVWQTAKDRWSFKESSDRNGDGDKKRPDVISRFSHVRIIEQNDQQIIIHWRYFPDFSSVEWGDVVEEYYHIYPDGRIERIIRPGTETIDDWNAGEGKMVQNVYLRNDGIEYSDVKSETDHSVKPQLGGKPQTIIRLKDLMLQFKFDHISEDSALESKSRQLYKIQGHTSLYKKGISFNALNFDGYYSGIFMDSISNWGSINNFTVQAWVALSAYPFDWAPVLQKSDWGKTGFYLGINEDGYAGLHMAVGNKWISVVDSNQIDLFQWYHLAGVYDSQENKISLYIDGVLAAELKVKLSEPVLSSSPLTIGLNRQKMPVIEGRIRRGKWPSLFGIDGLIDEVILSSKLFTPTEIKEQINSFKPEPKDLSNPDLQRRKLPETRSFETDSQFLARYTRLKYYETWDNMWRVGDYPDIVVSFDRLPADIVFWRGTSYGPFFVTENGLWIGDQSNEDYRLLEYKGEAEGCLEHMSDKQCRHSHVRIIENTPARKVIHWRYGLVDSRYLFAPWNGGWGGWTDEYWTIYPDGVAVRNVTRGIVFGDGWVETMFLSAPGTRPEDNCELQAYTVMDVSEKLHRFSWADEAPEGVVDDVMLTIVNSKSKYRMFNVYPDDSFIEIFGGHSHRSKFHWWNHWPVSQITSDGRGARAADRVAHSSLAHGGPGTHYLLYGITDKTIEELTPLASSWRNPPEISVHLGIAAISHQPEERAWHIEAESDVISFTMNASLDKPVYNPALLIKNMKRIPTVITVNDHILENSEYKIGQHYSDNGLITIIWIEYQSDNEIKIEIK